MAKKLRQQLKQQIGQKQFIGPPHQGCGEKKYSKHILETLKP